MPTRNPYSARWKFAGIGFLLSLVTVILTHIGLFEGLEYQMLDYWFHLRGEHTPHPAIVVVSIDDRATQRLGELPWLRNRLADLIRQLDRAGARLIVIDLGLTGPDPQSAANDGLLRQAIDEADNVLLPFYFSNVPRPRIEQGITSPLPPACVYLSRPSPPLIRVNQVTFPYSMFVHAALGLGHINMYPERDGILRKAPLCIDFGGRLYPSLGLEAARVVVDARSTVEVQPGKHALFAGQKIPVDGAMEMMLNFAGGYQTFPYYSALDVLKGDVGPRALRDKIVVVGSTAARQSSFFPTPFTQVFPGVEIHATVIDNILENRPLRRAPRLLNMLFLLLIGSAIGIILSEQKPVFSSIYAVIVAGGIVVSVFYLFVARLVWFDSVRPLWVLFWTYLVVLVYRLRLEEQESARTQSVVDTLVKASNIVGSSLDLPRLFQLLLDWVTDMLNAEAGSILLLDESRQLLRFEATNGPKSESVRQYSLRVGEGIAGWVVQHGEPVIANEVEKDVRFTPAISESIDYPTRSILCVPLQSKNTVVGAIEIINKRGGSVFTPADQKMLTAMANQAGVILENARLYALLEERVELANQRLVEANQELSVEKGKLEAVVRSMAEGVLVLDAEGRVVFVNPAARRIFDLGQTQPFVGERFETVAAQRDLVLGIEKVFAEKQETVIREFRVAEGHSRIYGAHLAPVRDAQEEMLGVVIVLNDITELKELDTAKSDFVSFVSHELRSPITAIKGFASTLLREDADDPEFRTESLTIIAQECDRMSRLISSLLDLSRIEAGRALELHWQRVNLAQIMESVLDRHRLYVTHHTLSLHIAEDVPMLYVDPDKIEQVLINLVGNAIKYSPHGGGIRLAARRDDERVVVSVQDQGIGIAKDQIGKLFQRYQRVAHGHSRKIAGTGLGLFLTRHLVQAHGGDIWVESEEGKGSTFYFYLPLTAPPDS